ncbi:MAG: GNAT family N-acetyltransferase [Parasporobacterium sp.]|nr:GNAT family N-acetyltransferase [Parasporobacterium sp.]
MALETERLLFRRWEESDAEILFEEASNPEVGPPAGWQPHKNVEESLEIIRNVLNGPEAYAICLKENGKPIGTIELRLKDNTDMTDKDDECELGYWLAREFWGQGIMPEAAQELLRHAFEDLGMTKVWCGYYDGNNKSKRVQEKCGFTYQWTTEGLEVKQMNEIRTGHVNMLTKEEWEAQK